ncbi:hypothetical protein [Paenibacillus massiliensis]|uniref:hypothetical protein n=1 Tax=Paenibacillus massiliensis TaxID=225917 RepID=UPI0004B8F1FA|nr:hypothetical protein [Paenibacillus massiliensis]
MNWNAIKVKLGMRLGMHPARSTEEGSFTTGIIWGLVLSAVLWVSIIGWISMLF